MRKTVTLSSLGNGLVRLYLMLERTLTDARNRLNPNSTHHHSRAVCIR